MGTTQGDYPERDELLEGMALATHACAWGDREEEEGRSYCGCDLLKVCPEPSPTAKAWAERLLAGIEEANEYGTFHDAIAMADRERDVETLGHYLAMEAMGHGVAWNDSYPDHRLTVPYQESVYYFDCEDYDR